MNVPSVTILRTLLPLCLAALAACAPEMRPRSAAPCPLPPPPPECRATPTSADRLLPDPWSMVPVQGLDTPGTEEFFTGDTLRGASYATLERTTGRQRYGTLVPADKVMGDADVVEFTPEPRRMPFSTDVYWDGHPTMVRPGLLIYASDRPGTIGGTDLWYVHQDAKGQWSIPARIEALCSPCDDLSPWYVAAEKMLYFSSIGHGTLGGYDVVRARIDVVRAADGSDSVVASSVQNMGAPVNSAKDDIFPVVQGDSIYVTSDRRDGTDMDVYVSYRPTDRRTPTRPVKPVQRDSVRPTATITGTVINEETQRPVADAEVTARDTRTQDVVGTTRTDTSGSYRLQIPVDTPIEVAAQSEDLFYDTYTTTLPSTDAGRVVERTEKLTLPTVFYLRVNFPTAIFDAPYDNTLDSNGAETMQRWSEAIDKVADNVLQSGRTLKRLVLIGHTDDVGTDASNMTLGRQRVEFVMSELVKRGVPQEILEGRSAGERLKPDRRPNEPIDVWRKRARRVELVKVLQR